MGLDINLTTNIDNTPLMEASKRGRVACVRLLLELKADTSATNNDGKTALQLAKNDEVKAVIGK